MISMDNLPNHTLDSGGLAELAQARRRTRAGDEALVIAPCQGPSAEPSAGAPFQFRLRSMLMLVAAVSGLLAIMQLIGAVWSAILVWFLLLVLAHVTANFWGTHVAPAAGRRPSDGGQPDSLITDGPLRSAPIIGAVRLSESLRPGWPMFVATATGAVVGGTLGSVALVVLNFDQAGYAGVAVGSVSAAIVGGFLGFLTSSFVSIGLRAWKEALSGAAPIGHDKR
jgi:hypothetical protein